MIYKFITHKEIPLVFGGLFDFFLNFFSLEFKNFPKYKRIVTTQNKNIISVTIISFLSIQENVSLVNMDIKTLQ